MGEFKMFDFKQKEAIIDIIPYEGFPTGIFFNTVSFWGNEYPKIMPKFECLAPKVLSLQNIKECPICELFYMDILLEEYHQSTFYQER